MWESDSLVYPRDGDESKISLYPTMWVSIDFSLDHLPTRERSQTFAAPVRLRVPCDCD